MRTDLANSTLFPIVLHGEYKVVRPQWRKIVREAIRLNSWDAMRESCEFLPIDELPGWIHSDYPRPIPKGDFVQASVTWPELYDITSKQGDVMSKEGRDTWFKSLRDLTLDGCQDFWFCLGLLGKGSMWLPGGSSFDGPDERRRIGKAILGQFVRWWPEFIRLEPRFTATLYRLRWPLWCPTITELAYEIGATEDDVVRMNEDKVEDAVNRIKSWIDANR